MPGPGAYESCLYTCSWATTSDSQELQVRPRQIDIKPLLPFWPAGDLPAQEIDRRSDQRAEQTNFLSVKKRPGAKSGIISFVTIQHHPNSLVQDLVHLDRDDARLLRDARVSILDEPKPSQKAVSMKPKTLQDRMSLSRQTAPTKRTVRSKERWAGAFHFVFRSEANPHKSRPAAARPKRRAHCGLESS
jgi:hypothetical protein